MENERLGWDEVYLNMAKALVTRGTCLRRNFAALVVDKDMTFISSGYTGAPRGTPNCSTDLEKCFRNDRNIPSGKNYELCRSVHAEQNAIINAARKGTSVTGGIIYLYGEDKNNGDIVEAKPCLMCKRVIINSGIEKVVIMTPTGIQKYNVSDWVRGAKENPYRDLDV